jgi:hypothetical protein
MRHLARRRRSTVLMTLGVLVFVASAWAAFAPLPTENRELVYVIPKGTARRQATGAAVDVLPRELRLTVGVRDVLVLRNEDDATARLGPALLAPGQTYRIPFHAPADFQLSCSVHRDGAITISVQEAPGPGWPRLRWRLEEVLRS